MYNTNIMNTSSCSKYPLRRGIIELYFKFIEDNIWNKPQMCMAPHSGT